MSELELDHGVIHIDDREACHRFYVDLLGLEWLVNPEGQANPLGAWVCRHGNQQINIHGPWPDRSSPCCPPPLNEPGRANLAFRSSLSAEENVERLRTYGVDVESGPTRRFGARGWGISVYCRDPSGNDVELISYDEA